MTKFKRHMRLATLMSWTCLPAVSSAQLTTPVSIGDAIGMTRIQRTYEGDDRPVVFSPDGSVAATVVWRGDVSRDCNVYSLLTFDLRRSGNEPGAPTLVLSLDFYGDSSDQVATPISQVQIMADNRTITFLGTLRGEPRQIYAVDRVTHRIRALTHHQSDVRSYGMGPDGQLRIFSAVSNGDSLDNTRRSRNGYLIPGSGARVGLTALFSAELAPRTRQYFMPLSDSTVLVFDSKASTAETAADSLVARDSSKRKAASPPGSPQDDDTPKSLSVDPTGKYALMWPYTTPEVPARPEKYRFFDDKNLYENRMAAPYALIDLQSGRLTRFIDAIHDPFVRNAGAPIWSPDGHSVIISSLLPLDTRESVARGTRSDSGPELIEVNVASRRVSPLHVTDQWRAVGWIRSAGIDEVILLRGQTVASVTRDATGWSSLTIRGNAEGFNRRYPVSTTGLLIAGVKDSLTMPPEIALYDLSRRHTTVLTDLNPQLRNRRMGAIEKIHWRGPYDSASFGYLIKPPDYQAGRHYPLLVLLKDAPSDDTDNSFLLDGQGQLGGYAIQTFATDGFVILFTPDAPSLREVAETPEEGPHEVAHIESGIAYLSAQGIIDSMRVAIAGWSRAAYETEYVLTHTDHRFVAASQLDGGGLFDYNTGEFVPLERSRTPILLEIYNRLSMAGLWPYVERLGIADKPIDVFYYAGSPHNPTQPAARWHSISRNEDWFRYWLQDWRDPDPAKRDQYARWDAMRHR